MVFFDGSGGEPGLEGLGDEHVDVDVGLEVVGLVVLGLGDLESDILLRLGVERFHRGHDDIGGILWNRNIGDSLARM